MRDFYFDVQLSKRIKDQMKNNKLFPFTARWYQELVSRIRKANVISK